MLRNLARKTIEHATDCYGIEGDIISDEKDIRFAGLDLLKSLNIQDYIKWHLHPENTVNSCTSLMALIRIMGFSIATHNSSEEFDNSDIGIPLFYSLAHVPLFDKPKSSSPMLSLGTRWEALFAMAREPFSALAKNGIKKSLNIASEIVNLGIDFVPYNIDPSKYNATTQKLHSFYCEAEREEIAAILLRPEQELEDPRITAAITQRNLLCSLNGPDARKKLAQLERAIKDLINIFSYYLN